MKRFFETLGIILIIIGLGFLIWGSINYTTYPNLLKIMKEAFATAWLQYVSGLILIFGGYALINGDYGNRKKER